jgi:hypothetical protein
MFRKTLTVLAASAVIAGGTAGVAYADTPAPAQRPTLCGTIALPVVCTPSTGGHDGDHRGGHFGGGFGGGFRGGNFGGTYWNRGGVILPYSQVASSCGCSDPASLGYTLVEQPAQVEVVPVAADLGDGSCALDQVNWNDRRFSRGVRFFRR